MRSVDRMDRVNANLLRILSGIVQAEIADSGDLVTLTTALTTPDLKQVTLSVSATKNASDYVQLLNRRSGQIRNRLKPHLDFKVIPYVIFVEDNQGTDIARVEQLLDTLS